MTDFSDKVAVVLGASAPTGSGWAIAEALAAQGAKVVVGARRYEPLKVLAERIEGTATACDATNEDQVKALAQVALKTYGRLDIAISTAFSPAKSLIADSSIELVKRAMETNYCCHVYFVKHMAEAIRENGSIVLFSSVSATNTYSPVFAYACAKAATDCLVRYAALELGRRGIRVNSILPGGILSKADGGIFAIPGMQEVWNREIPLGRLGVPKDYADAALWLAGPSFVTGLNLQVSGGHQLTRLPYLDEQPVLSL
jgi:NAD(P)-dependent dehydrogenase (short-subunit alcohol dehydrogenase family)